MKEIKAMPLYVHLDDGFIFICLRDGTYIIYNKDLDSIFVDNAKLIFSSYRLRENKIMFGFEDGNAMILTINQEGQTQTVEMDDINWRKNNGFHFEHSRIICMGQASNRHYAFSKDGLVQQFNQMTPQNNTQIQWDFLIHKIHITQTAIFICQETRFCALPITYNLETFNLKTFNFLSSQQIFIDGTSIDKIEQHPKFCETLKMHNGIQFIDSTHDQLFILLKDGNLIIYTYGPFKDGIKVNLIKRLKFEFINPIGFNLANANQVMVAFKHKRMYFDYENLTIQQQYELPFKLKGNYQFYRSYDLIWGGRQLHLNFYRSNCLAKDGCFELVEYI